jgi:hypothetical protein
MRKELHYQIKNNYLQSNIVQLEILNSKIFNIKININYQIFPMLIQILKKYLKTKKIFHCNIILKLTPLILILFRKIKFINNWLVNNNNKNC